MFCWPPDGEILAYIITELTTIVIKDINSGDTKKIENVGGDGRLDDIDWSPDGQWLAIAKLKQVAQIWMVENFFIHSIVLIDEYSFCRLLKLDSCQFYLKFPI